MPGVPHEASAYRTQRAGPPLDRLISELAARQHGRISLAQLRYLGLNGSTVRSRVETGRLLPRRRGVYAVGHAAFTPEGLWMEAVLAYGRCALSHRSGMELWGLVDGCSRPVHVSVPKPSARSRRGI